MADYKRLRVKMKNIRFLPNATTKPTQHFEHDICIINLTIIIAVHLSVYCGGKSDNCSTIEITYMSFCLVCSVVSILTRNLLQSSVMSKIDEVVYVGHYSMEAGF